MTTQYFADSWYIIALINRFDPHHASVVRLQRELRHVLFVTHDAVFMEVLTFYSGFGSNQRRVASQIVREWMRDMLVLPAGRDLFLAGLDLYERRPDKEYSLVDCMSMVVMETHGIRHVLTNDHHFSQAGFIIVNE